MWITKIWVALIVSCVSPGTPDESCHGEPVRGFVRLIECEAAIAALTELTQHTAAPGSAVTIHATCQPVTPDREA